MKPEQESEIGTFYDLRGERKLKSRSRQYGSQQINFFLTSPYKKAQWHIRQSREPQKQQCFLDLCCGTGRHSIFPAKLGYQVFGNDISKKSIATANELARENQVGERCQFIHQDTEEFLNREQSYDLIFISGSLYYLNRKEILSKIYNSLRPGGTFIAIETNGSNGLLNVYRRIRNLFVQDRDETSLKHLINLSELDRWSEKFDNSRTYYFDLFTLLTPSLFILPPLAALYFKWAKKLDSFILRLPLMKFLSFKFLFFAQRST